MPHKIKYILFRNQTKVFNNILNTNSGKELIFRKYIYNIILFLYSLFQNSADALSRAFYIRKNRDFIFSILAVSGFRNLQLKVSKIKIRYKKVIQMQLCYLQKI